MKKEKISLLVAAFFVFATSSFAQFHSGDMAVLINLRTSNFSSATELNWNTDPNPDNWDGVIWTSTVPKRVKELHLGEYGQGKSIGVITALQGAMDLRGLDSLQLLYLFRNTDLYTLDITNLPSLSEVYCPRTGIKAIEANNCPKLSILKCKKSYVASIHLSGDTSLTLLDCEYNGVTSLDLTGLKNLSQILAQENNIASMTVTGCTSLNSMDVNKNRIPYLDLTGLVNLTSLIADWNLISDIKGIDTINVSTLIIDHNLLSFKRAVQLYNHPTAVGNMVAYQLGYAPQTVALNDSVDFSDADSILVSGSNASTTFELYDASNGSLIGSNTTGIFQMTSAGAFYITMSNSGYSMNSGSILVGGGVTPDPSFSASDYNILMNIRKNNFTGGYYNWGSVTNLNQMDGVTWDTTISPARVTELILSKDGPTNNPQKGINLNLRVSGNVNFTGLDSLHRLELVKQAGVTDVVVTGLNELTRLFLARTGIDVLDLSGNLSPMFLNCAGSGIRAINLTGCSNMVRLKAKKSINLIALDITGCTSIKRTALRATGLSTLDVSGFTSITNIGLVRSRLKSLIAVNCVNLKKINCRNSYISNLDLTNSNAITDLRCSRNRLTQIDLTNKTGLLQLRCGRNKVDSIPGFLALPSITRFRMRENRLTLTKAAQAFNITTLNNKNLLNQDAYPPVTIFIIDSIDHSDEDTVLINSVPVPSQFIAYTSAGIPIDTNTTGIFYFPAIGDYYITMYNSGVWVTTGTITVIDTMNPAIDGNLRYDFGDVCIDSTMTEPLTVYNTGKDTLLVNSIIMPAGFSIDYTTATILPGDSAILNVTFTPIDNISYNGALMVLSNAVIGNSIFDVTGKGIVCIDSTIGITEDLNIQQTISFYPNPANALVRIELSQGLVNHNQNMIFEVLSIEGNLVKTIDLRKDNVVFIGDLPNGMYLMQSLDRSVRGRFVKN